MMLAKELRNQAKGVKERLEVRIRPRTPGRASSTRRARNEQAATPPKERTALGPTNSERSAGTSKPITDISDASTTSDHSNASTSTSMFSWMPFFGASASVARSAASGRGDDSAGASRQSSGSSAEAESEDIAYDVPMHSGPLRFEIGNYAAKGVKSWAPRECGQDVHLLLPLDGDKIVIGVFDGHGPEGFRAADFARQQFAQAFGMLQLEEKLDEERALKEIFAKVQASFRYRSWARSSGTTATVALLDPVQRTMTCAHVGDSTLALMQGKKTLSIFSTTDHNFELPEERARVTAMGGYIQTTRTAQNRTTHRVHGLAVSRTLGDLDCHSQGVSSDPDVHKVDLLPGYKLILASDGLWNQLEPPQAFRLAASAPTSEVAAKQLVAQAHGRWLQQGHYVDDITTMVVRIS